MNSSSNYKTPEFVKKFGGYNDFPPSYREIDMKEFGRVMNHYNYDFSEHRQMIDETLNPYAISATLFHFWNGIGVGVTQEGILFAFGCDHTMESTPWDSETMGPRYNCLNAFKCSKCGFVQVLDSSD